MRTATMTRIETTCSAQPTRPRGAPSAWLRVSCLPGRAASAMAGRMAELRQGNDSGAAMAEYGLLVAGVAVAVAALVYAFGDDVAELFSDISFSG